MKYEIDFLPVGDKSKGGDAICFRYWDDFVPQFVGVVDGGNTASGEAIVKHIRTHYGTDTVDLVINTHPHADHASGLYEVLHHLEVKKLMMHLPWAHAASLRDLFHDGRITSDSLERRVRDALQHAHDLQGLAVGKSVMVVEPFVGVDTGSPCIKILGPTLPYYQELLLDFTSTPEKVSAAALAEAIQITAGRVLKWFKEQWNAESLVAPVRGTNPENNSSVVTLFDFGDEKVLLTGDAGVPALEAACSTAAAYGVELRKCRLVQVPHHGSKRNVSPEVLNLLLGGPTAVPITLGAAIASVPVEGQPKHPSRRVLNAFLRRGFPVTLTKGQLICFRSSTTPMREGWSKVESQPFFDDFEDDESD